MSTTKPTHLSYVLETAAADCSSAYNHFLNKLKYETDPADVYRDMKNGVADFVLIDVRSPEAYAKSHAIGSINMPHTNINEETMTKFSKDKLIVVYCWGPGCNGATKAAVKLSALGFAVKEMIGGIEYWQEKDNLPVERG